MKSRLVLRLIAGLVIFGGLLVPLVAQEPGLNQGVRLSKDRRHLVNRDGKPFYWIGDTAWALFQRLTREEIDDYLDDRKAKGFNVIQAVAYWYPHGPFDPIGPSNESNAYGHRPFLETNDATDTSKPRIIEGGSADSPNDYWDHVDYAIRATRERGFTFVVLPCWGNAFINSRMDHSQVEFTTETARSYGRFLGERYADQPHVIWCLGGDVDPVHFGEQDQRSVYRAMAEGLGQGTSGNDHLRWNVADPDWDQSTITFHAVRAPKLSGAEGGSSSTWFHHDAWLDFNMMETFRWMHRIYPLVTEDTQLRPTKPTVLGEGAYEIGKYGNDCGFITPLKVRRQGYHAFFAGAAGYTYGCWAVWPFRGEYCDKTWRQSLDLPGATDVGTVMRDFVESRKLFAHTPDQKLILSSNPPGERMQCAMLRNDHHQILVYFPDRSPAKIDVGKLDSDGACSVVWFDPRDGMQTNRSVTGDNVYVPPQGWEDAILILTRN
ncbi:MAG: DUF4038 domain-containing protein [Planctomycetota bacterium]